MTAEENTTASITEEKNDTPYLVLARKYRPQNFSGLIGQDALVRTLTNAIAMDRVAHAFMLTGVRGIGKTTTARILALSFNCIGTDGKSDITATPCGECTHCKAITQGRHIDVLEMDAASRTGVDDVREIIESVQYAPTSARYKIYIIDEVHMLTKQAFNALLKTLEEPPPHVKFIFATTEINKVPVTILSRCQRFDLQRINSETLQTYFFSLLEKENIIAENEAVALISKAADGSARDGLSLLDRAISLSDGSITTDLVQGMLGLSDRNMLFDLFESLITGDSKNTLSLIEQLYTSGGDPQNILKDLLNITHLLTKGKAAPLTLDAVHLTEIERERGKKITQDLSIPALTRLWQILFQGYSELKTAPEMQQALEMIFIRALYAAELPLPQDLIGKLKNSPVETRNTEDTAQKKTPDNNINSTSSITATVAPTAPVTNPVVSSEATAVAVQPQLQADGGIYSFRELSELFKSKQEMLLYSQIYNFMTPIKFEQGKIELYLDAAGDRDAPGQVVKKLSEWTGERWILSLVSKIQKTATELTLAEEDSHHKQQKLANTAAHPIVEQVLEIFPGAKITSIKDINN